MLFRSLNLPDPSSSNTVPQLGLPPVSESPMDLECLPKEARLMWQARMWEASCPLVDPADPRIMMAMVHMPHCPACLRKSKAGEEYRPYLVMRLRVPRLLHWSKATAELSLDERQNLVMLTLDCHLLSDKKPSTYLKRIVREILRSVPGDCWHVYKSLVSSHIARLRSSSSALLACWF